MSTTVPCQINIKHDRMNVMGFATNVVHTTTHGAVVLLEAARAPPPVKARDVLIYQTASKSLRYAGISVTVAAAANASPR